MWSAAKRSSDGMFGFAKLRLVVILFWVVDSSAMLDPVTGLSIVSKVMACDPDGL